MEKEEPGEAELADEVELLLQSLADALLVAVEIRVALGERGLADAAKLDDRRLRPVGEVGVAVAELLRQVELEAFGKNGAQDDDIEVANFTTLMRRTS